MNLTIGNQVFVESSVTWRSGIFIAPAIVTSVYPDTTGNLDPSVAPVTVNVTAFPDSVAPVSVQQIQVYQNRSQGGFAARDNGGWAFVVDDTVSLAPAIKPRPVVK